MEEFDELQLVDRWIDWLAHNKGRSESTCIAYRRFIVRLQEYLRTQSMTLLQATPSALEDFSGRYLHSQGVRPISRRAIVSAIRSFYPWLTQHHLLQTNPAHHLPCPKAGRALPSPMSVANAEKLLMKPGISTFIGVRDTAMLAVLMATGCRVSGLVGLNEENLIWTRNAAGSEQLIIRLTEKGKKERLVPAPLEAALLVRAYLGHPDLAEIDRATPTGRRVLFVSTFNRHVPVHEYHGEHRRINRCTVFRMIRNYGEQVGIPTRELHPHAIRHLYGTELAEDDADLLQRQALLGHEQPGTTAIYSHLAMRKLAKIVEKSNPLAKMSDTPARVLANRIKSRESRSSKRL